MSKQPFILVNTRTTATPVTGIDTVDEITDR